MSSAFQRCGPLVLETLQRRLVRYDDGAAAVVDCSVQVACWVSVMAEILRSGADPRTGLRATRSEVRRRTGLDVRAVRLA